MHDVPAADDEVFATAHHEYRKLAMPESGHRPASSPKKSFKMVTSECGFSLFQKGSNPLPVLKAVRISVGCLQHISSQVSRLKQ
jgi:hypothetical protein